MKADERKRKRMLEKMLEITPTNYINQGKNYLFDYVEKREIH